MNEPYNETPDQHKKQDDIKHTDLEFSDDEGPFKIANPDI
jgi:hypothetical protein